VIFERLFLDTEPWFGFTDCHFKTADGNDSAAWAAVTSYNGNVKFTSNVTYAESNLDGAVLAESDQTEVVEGNHYSIHEHFKSSQTHDMPWKGACQLPGIEVDGQVNKDAWTIQPLRRRLKH